MAFWAAKKKSSDSFGVCVYPTQEALFDALMEYRKTCTDPVEIFPVFVTKEIWEGKVEHWLKPEEIEQPKTT